MNQNYYIYNDGSVRWGINMNGAGVPLSEFTEEVGKYVALMGPQHRRAWAIDSQ